MDTHKTCLTWFLWLVGIVFVILKLSNIIAWNWWLVLMPFYIGFAIYVLCIALLIGTIIIYGSFVLLARYVLDKL